MIHNSFKVSLLIVGLLGIGGLAFIGSGCESASKTPAANSSTPAAQPASGELASNTGSGKSGAELWAQTCSHCHNLRSPSSFNSAQWEVIVMHMRQRANLTGQEARSITEFLKASSQ